MRAGYPLSKDGKKIHAVRGSIFEYDGEPGASDAKVIGVSVCDHRVEVRGDEQFDPSADNACSRCASATA